MLSLDTPVEETVAGKQLIAIGMGKGRLEGRVEGRLEGRLEGRVEGKNEGKIEGQIEMLKALIRSGEISPESGTQKIENLKKKLAKLKMKSTVLNAHSE